jgi:signal transduction histidine kinase
MTWSFPALNLGSFLIWSALFAASGTSMVVSVNDVIRVARRDEARFRLISRIEKVETELRHVELESGEYITYMTAAPFDAYARARSALKAEMRDLKGDASSDPFAADIARLEESIVVGVNRIDAAVSGRRSGDEPEAARLVVVDAEGAARVPLEEPLRLLTSLSAAIEQRTKSENNSLERNRDEVIRSFGAAGVLCLLFQGWLYTLMRRDLKMRNAVQQELKSANDRLGEHVLERTRELGERNRQLVFVTGKVLEMQERERRCIALELHDEIGQDLAALIMLQRSLVRDGSGQRRQIAAQTVANCIELTQAIYDQVGDISLTLRPSILDRLGFAAALNWYVRQAEKRSNCRIAVSACEVPDGMPENISLAAFRIVQEAISNALRHAQARNMRVHVCCERQMLSLCIADDGVGFDMRSVVRDPDPHSGFGILGMQERARIAGGTLVVESEPGHGTRVAAKFPLPPAEALVGHDAGAIPADGRCTAGFRRDAVADLQSRTGNC